MLNIEEGRLAPVANMEERVVRVRLRRKRSVYSEETRRKFMPGCARAISVYHADSFWFYFAF